MLLIAAALGEELEVALRFFPLHSKSRVAGVALRRALAPWDTTLLFLKTGIGPGRSARRVRKVLQEIRPAKVLVIGYAGALDPRLRVGDLMVPQKAISLLPQQSGDLPLKALKPGSGVDLLLWPDLHAAAGAAGLEINLGPLLTSAEAVGNPEQKSLLFRESGAQAVDMETAAIAALASDQGIPIGCVRVISDTAADRFLEPFVPDPSAGFARRASKLALPANWAEGYRQWRRRTAVARERLHLFLAAYLKRVGQE